MAEIQYLEINDITRMINVPVNLLLGVREDKDVKKLYFKCKKIVEENVDLSKHQIYVKYINALDKSGKRFDITNPKICLCGDVTTQGDYITFSWLMSESVFAKEGFIAFSVLASDGENTRWNTYPAIGTVLNSVPGGLQEVAGKYPDIITQLLNRMSEVEKIATKEAMQEYVNTYLTAHPGEIDETLTDSKKAAPADVVGQLKEDLCDLTEKDGTEIIQELFEFGIVESDGRVTYIGHTALENIFSKIISVNGMKIRPKKSDTIFKVAYYLSDGTFERITPWMGLGSTYATVDEYIIDGDYCRLCIANETADINTNTIEEHLGKYNFSGNEKTRINGDKINFHNNELIEKITLPFLGFKFDEEIYKQNGKYGVDINPTKNYIKKAEGRVVYMSADGSHEADGLTVLTPVKTISKALSIENVETIIMLEGHYVSTINFYIGENINTDVNIIGMGEVVVENAKDGVVYDPICFTGNVYCENIKFKRGNNTVIAKLDENKIVTFYKCEFSESDTLNGLSVLGGKAYVIECIAYDNAFDGFNYHANDKIVNHALEINCVSYGNGTYRLMESDGQSSNATTSHDGSYIVRINGDYKCCHGGVVADKECKSANYGCNSGISTVTDDNYPDRMSSYWSGGAEMHLIDCTSYGSKYDTACINGGRIVSNIEYLSKFTS